MEIGSQILVVLIFIFLLLSVLYFVKKNTEKIKTLTSGGRSLIDVKDTKRIDTYHRLSLVQVSEKQFLILTSKNGTNVIQQIT